jgi:hypothetical protein
MARMNVQDRGQVIGMLQAGLSIRQVRHLILILIPNVRENRGMI